MPPPVEDRVRYNFGAMSECAIAIDNFVTLMNNHLSDVETKMEGKMSDWDGSTRTEYINSKMTWNNAAGRIEDLLRDVAGGVDEACEGMAMTEKMCADSMEW